MTKDKENRLHTRIVNYVKQGLRPAQAAVLAGISERTYYRMIERDDKFVSMIESAEAHLELNLAKSIKDIAKTQKNPQALVALLERRYPGRWSSKVTSEITGANGQSVVFKVDMSGGYLPPQAITSTLIPTIEKKPEPS